MRSSRLAILPEEAALRGSGPFVEPLHAHGLKEDDVPTALRNLGQIIDGGLCHRCGSCIGICPTGVLSVDEDDYPRVKHLSACTDCDLCVKVCPGDELDYSGLHEQIFGAPPDLSSTHGTFLRAVVAHSTDPEIRERSTSGGIVTAILLHLLETGQIDGAVVVGSDEEQLWKGKAVLARSRAEILASMKSKYAICPTNAVFDQIRRKPGRYAVVGLPCQIHGLHKTAALHARFRSRIAFSIGVFCHAAVEHEAFRTIWGTLGDKRSRARRFVSRVGKHPGTPKVELDDGTWHPVYFGSKRGYRPSSIEGMNLIYRLYTPPRCMTCFDALSELSDISVGDPWLPSPRKDVSWYDGWSFTLVRTQRGMEAFNQLLGDRKVQAVDITPKEALVSNKMMAHEKRGRAFSLIRSRSENGEPVPRYGSLQAQFPQPRGIGAFKVRLNLLSHFFCFHPSYRRKILQVFLSPAGYWLFWLNNQRRKLRVWSRDSLYRARTMLFGRR